MITPENWNDDYCFIGNGSAVIIVTYARYNTNDPLEFYVEGIGLNSCSEACNMKAYFWDKRDLKVAREYYEKTFEIGSIWRISGQIEYDEDGIVFIDPVYMPYSGKACELLNTKLESKQ